MKIFLYIFCCDFFSSSVVQRKYPKYYRFRRLTFLKTMKNLLLFVTIIFIIGISIVMAEAAAEPEAAANPEPASVLTMIKTIKGIHDIVKASKTG